VLIALCALLLGAERALRGRARIFRVGSGVARPAEPVALGRKTVPALAAVLAVVVVALGVPLGSVGYWLLRDGSNALDPVGLASASATTFALGITVAGVTVLLALPVALLAVRHRGHVATLVERATYLAHALPGIAVALALAAVSIRLAPALYQTAVLLIIGYSILFLPRTLSSVRAALEKAPPSVEEAARALGHRPLAVLWRVTIPLVAPGIGAGAALGFLSVITELTTTLLLAPIGTQTLATRVWSHTSRLAYQAAAPYAALMVSVSLPATLLLTRRLATLGRVGTT
jgi:iron(III) transport system permease protein